MLGRQVEHTFGWFAGGKPIGTGFDAMINSIANQMG